MQYYILQCKTMQSDTVKCKAMLRNIMQYNAMQMQCNKIQCNAKQYNTIQYNAMQYNATQCNEMLYNTMHCNVRHCNVMQYNIKFTWIHILSYAPCVTYQIQLKHWDAGRGLRTSYFFYSLCIAAPSPRQTKNVFPLSGGGCGYSSATFLDESIYDTKGHYSDRFIKINFLSLLANTNW